MTELRGWLIAAALTLAWLGCGHTPVSPLPEEGGIDGSSDGSPAEATPTDSAEDRAADAGSEAGGGDAGFGSDADAGVGDGGVPDGGCTDCDGSSCCAPLVCRASGNCSTCLGVNESCGGNQDCCSHVCNGGLCQ